MIELNYQILGKGPNLFILHGLYGSSDNWLTYAKKLSQYYQVILPDLRNHGNSPHSASMTISHLSDDLYHLINKMNIEKSILLGHSLGGKVAMDCTLKYPERISSLIVIDIAPKSYIQLDHYSKQVIEHLNIIDTLMSANLETIESRSQLDDQISLRIPDSRVRQFLMKNIVRNGLGKFEWKINLDAIRNNLPDLMGWVESSNSCNVQSMFIRGEQSEYIQDSDFELIKKKFPLADIVTIFEAGHWVHVDQAKQFEQTLNHFLGISL